MQSTHVHASLNCRLGPPCTCVGQTSPQQGLQSYLKQLQWTYTCTSYMCTCTCVHVHVYMYMCTCTCVHVHVYMYMCTCVHVHVYIYTCTCTCTCVHIHMYMYMYMCTIEESNLNDNNHCEKQEMKQFKTSLTHTAHPQRWKVCPRVILHTVAQRKCT